MTLPGGTLLVNQTLPQITMPLPWSMKKLPLISVPDFLARFPQAADRGRRAQSAAAMECIGRPHRQNEAGRHPQQPALCRSPGLGTSSPGKNS